MWLVLGLSINRSQTSPFMKRLKTHLWQEKPEEWVQVWSDVLSPLLAAFP